MRITNKLGKIILFAIFIALFTISCNGIYSPDPLVEATPTTIPSPAEEPIQSLDSSDNSPTSLTLWLPPEFNLSGDSEASILLRERIEAFQDLHPNLTIEVRIKAHEGPANLLESIAAAQEAAPLSLPDLVLLSVEDMESAATRMYIQPIGEYIPADFTEDKYEITLNLGTFQNEIYGMPFALDALVMTYHPEKIDPPPTHWAEVLGLPNVLAFPAASSNSLFTLALYLSNNNSITDENKKIALDAEKLEEIYSFYQSGQENIVFPYWLTQYEEEELSWQAFQEGRAAMAITWASRYLRFQSGINASSIPTKDGTPFTLTTGWVFSLVGTDPEKANISIELAEFLTASNFSGVWTESIGYLPPRPSALTEWQNDSSRAIANLILSSSGEIPPASTLNLLGEKLMQGTVSVLKQEQTAIEATLDIIDKFTN